MKCKVAVQVWQSFKAKSKQKGELTLHLNFEIHSKHDKYTMKLVFETELNQCAPNERSVLFSIRWSGIYFMLDHQFKVTIIGDGRYGLPLYHLRLTPLSVREYKDYCFTTFDLSNCILEYANATVLTLAIIPDTVSFNHLLAEWWGRRHIVKDQGDAWKWITRVTQKLNHKCPKITSEYKETK